LQSGVVCWKTDGRKNADKDEYEWKEKSFYDLSENSKGKIYLPFLACLMCEEISIG
jgi:hypothetical protein